MNSRIAFSCLVFAAMGAPLLAGDLKVSVINGTQDRPQPVAGTSVEVRDVATGITAANGATDLNGELVLTAISAGDYAVLIRGPGGFGEREIAVTIPPSGLISPPEVMLPRRAASVAQIVTLSSGQVISSTDVESRFLTGARVRIPAGTVVTGASGDTPTFALHPLDTVYTDVSFPAGLAPRTLVALDPVGVQLSPGVRLRLPNDEGLAEGEQQTVWCLEDGVWSTLARRPSVLARTTSS